MVCVPISNSVKTSHLYWNIVRTGRFIYFEVPLFYLTLNGIWAAPVSLQEFLSQIKFTHVLPLWFCIDLFALLCVFCIKILLAKGDRINDIFEIKISKDIIKVFVF